MTRQAMKALCMANSTTCQWFITKKNPPMLTAAREGLNLRVRVRGGVSGGVRASV